jgi:hypothetical protein
MHIKYPPPSPPSTTLHACSLTRARAHTRTCRLLSAIEAKDPSRTSVRVANTLEHVADLELLQAPGLPYTLPKQYAGLPVLTGGWLYGVHLLDLSVVSSEILLKKHRQSMFAIIAMQSLNAAPPYLPRCTCTSPTRCTPLSRPATSSNAPFSAWKQRRACMHSGRAVVELTIERADGSPVFFDERSENGPESRCRIQLVMDGYSGEGQGGSSQARRVA